MNTEPEVNDVNPEQFSRLLEVIESQYPEGQVIRSYDHGMENLRWSHVPDIGWIDQSCLSPDLMLLLCDLKQVDLHRFKNVGIDWMRFRCVLSGETETHMPGGGRKATQAKSAELLFLSEGTDCETSLSLDDSGLCYVDLYCSRNLFKEMVGSDLAGLPTEVCQILHGTTPQTCFFPIHLTPTMERWAQEIHTAPQHVVMKRLFLQFKAFGLLYELISGLRAEKSQTDLGMNEREASAIKRVYEILLKDYVSPPSLEQLARKVGVNRTFLAKRFREMFGVSIGEFCLELKMDQAWHRLSRTDEPVSHIAHRLGYEHTANFSTAVKKWFGQTPREIRQAG